MFTVHWRIIRKNERDDQLKRRLEKARDKYRDNRDNEDRIVKRIRLDAYRQYMRQWRSAETTFNKKINF